MSDAPTPRTDKALVDHMPQPQEWSFHYFELAKFSRQLERELAEAKRELLNWENREASNCPEDRSFEETISALQLDSISLRAQRDTLADAIKWAIEVGQVVGGSRVSLSEALAAVKGGGQ